MIKNIALATCSLVIFSGNAIAQKTQYKKTKAGLKYSFLKDIPGTKTVQEGSYVKMHIRTKVSDSSMFDSYKMNNDQPIEQQLTKELLGPFMEGFSLLSEGDSALLRLPIEVAFKDSPFPPFAKKGDPVTYEVKIFSIKSKAEYDAEKIVAAKLQNRIDDKLIRSYVKASNIKCLRSPSGIYYSVDAKGNGKHATTSDNVKVHYKGMLLDGTVFDSSYERGEPIEFPLSGVIKGWTEGIPFFEEGGKGKLIIPSSLAYGNNPPPGSKIKANEILMFDVELLEIKKPEVAPKPSTVDASAQNAIDDALIQEYVKQNGLKTQKTASGIYYIIEQKGNGKHANANDKVKVHYKGTHMDGTTFDSSYERGQPVDFPLSAVIKGWTEGIPLFEEGGKGKLIIPSSLAYGPNSPGGTIKPNEILIFDVELLEILK